MNIHANTVSVVSCVKTEQLEKKKQTKKLFEQHHHWQVTQQLHLLALSRFALVNVSKHNRAALMQQVTYYDHHIF